MKHRVVIDRWT